MSIITKKTAGKLFLFSMPLVLIFSIFTNSPLFVAIGLLFALSLMTLFLIKAEWGLLALIVMRPTIEFFSNRLTINITNSVTLNVSAALGLLVIFFALVFFIKHLLDQKSKLPPAFVSFAIVLFLGINIFSLFISINPLLGVYEIIRLLSIFSMFLLTYLVFSVKKNHLSLLWAILVSAIIPMIFAIFQLATGGGGGDLDGRLSGTLSDPNSFASFSLIVFAVLTYFFITEKVLKRKIVFAGLAFFTLFILLETLSRGAWLATFVFILLLALWKSPKSIFLALFFVVILFFSSETFHSRIEDVYNPPADSSVRWRFKQWENLFQVYKNRPLSGYGAGTEILIHEEEFGFYAGNPYPHNDILRSALETGLFGAVSFVLLFLAVVVASLKKYRDAVGEKRLALIMIILFLYLSEFVFGMTSNIFRSTAVQWCLWALLGISLLQTQKDTQEKD